MRNGGIIGVRLWIACLVVLIHLTSLPTSSNGEILLSTSASTAWNGQCNHPACLSQACSFPATYSPNSATANCSIKFAAGSYIGHTFTWSNSGIGSDTDISFAGDVYHLDMDISTYPSPVAINASGYTVYHSTISLVTSATTFMVYEGYFVNTSIQVESSTVTLYTIKSARFGPIDSARTVITLFATGVVTPNVSISSSALACSTSNGAFISASKIDHLTFEQAYFTGPSLLVVANPALVVTAILGPNSLLSFDASPLIDAPYLEVTVSSNTTISYGGMNGGGLTTGTLKRATLGPSTFSKVDFQCANLCSFIALRTTFVDCEVSLSADSSTLTSHTSVQSTFNVTTRGHLMLTALDSNAPSFNFARTTVNIDPSQIPSEPFLISGNPVLNTSITSSLTANALWLVPGTELQIANLTITTLISGAPLGYPSSDAATIFAHKRNPASLWPNVWNFSSITVSNTILDMTDLDMMAYTVSAPSLGIRNDLAALPPYNLSVTSAAPFTTTYPIITNITARHRGFFFSYPPHPGHTLQVTYNAPALNMKYFLVLQPATLEPIDPILPSPPNSVCPPLPYPEGFNCTDGVLVAYGSIQAPSIVLPPSAGVIQVLGNVTLAGPLIFSGTGATLNVSGCAVLPSVEINLEGQKDPSKGLPTDSLLLLSQDTSCQNSLLNTIVSVKQDSNACKKVSARQDGVKSTSSTLAVLFSVDDSKCNSNTKWIILGSVLGAVILILTSLVLVFTFNEKAKRCIRPFVARTRPSI